MCKEMIPGQMNIFDFINTDKDEELPAINEVIKRISEKYGYNFKYNESFNEWQHSYKKKVVLSVDESTYLTEDQKGQRFIGMSFNAGKEGWASPCDNMKEIYSFIERTERRVV